MQANGLADSCRVEDIPTGPDAIIRASMKGAVVNGDRRRPPARAARRSTGSRATRCSTSYRCMLLSRQARRQGDPAQESEPDLLPDQRRRPRGDARRRRPDAASPATTGSIPYYRDRALCLQLGVTPLEMLLGRRSAPRTIRASGGRQMPSHWGHTRAQHRLADRARPARRCCTRSAPPKPASSTAASPQIPDRDVALHADEVTYVSLGDGATSEGEFWEALNTACTRAAAGAVPGRGQRLRDLGAGRSADAGRRHLASGRVVSRPARRFDRRHRLLRQPTRDARGGRVRPRAQGPGARPRARASARTRTRCPTTRSCTRRRRSARPKRGAIRSRGSREFLQARTASRPTRSSRRSPPTSSARSTRPRTQALAGAEAGEGHRGAARSTRPTSIRRPPRSTRRRSPRASPTRWSRRSTAR